VAFRRRPAKLGQASHWSKKSSNGRLETVFYRNVPLTEYLHEALGAGSLAHRFMQIGTVLEYAMAKMPSPKSAHHVSRPSSPRQILGAMGSTRGSSIPWPKKVVAAPAEMHTREIVDV